MKMAVALSMWILLPRDAKYMSAAPRNAGTSRTNGITPAKPAPGFVEKLARDDIFNSYKKLKITHSGVE